MFVSITNQNFFIWLIPVYPLYLSKAIFGYACEHMNGLGTRARFADQGLFYLKLS